MQRPAGRVCLTTTRVPAMRNWFTALGACVAASVWWLAPANTLAQPLDFRDGRPRCDHNNRVLTIDGGFWEVTIGREDERLVLSYARGEVACRGASVTTVDRIGSMGQSSIST
jgi:hypothetical protein